MKFEQSSGRESFEGIAKEINEMAKRDQEMRINAKKNPEAWDPSIDDANTSRFKEIVGQIGWPTISKVGEKVSDNAWLLAQHADHDPAFQKQCLALMKAADEGDVPKANIAYLEDRILVGEGKLQQYGTQYFKTEAGATGVRPIEDMEHLNERRASMGLEPFDNKPPA